MGVSSKPLYVALDDLVGDNSNGPLPLPLEAQSRKQRVIVIKRGQIRSKRSRRILMKRRARIEGSRRPNIEKKVKTLRKLVPNSGESLGLDGLFREAAIHIMSLQTRVKAMQVMVDVLSGPDE